jgi:hypothetical protein
MRRLCGGEGCVARPTLLAPFPHQTPPNLNAPTANRRPTATPPRLEPRLVVRNCTMVVPLDREVDLKRYWSGVFNSPEQSAWLHEGLNVTAWEVGRAGERRVAIRAAIRAASGEQRHRRPTAHACHRCTSSPHTTHT